MNAKQIANAARKIESRRMNHPREVRTRATDKPVATVAVIPHKPGRRAVILEYGLEDVNACDMVLRFNEGSGSIGKTELKRLENICRQVVVGWLNSPA